MPADTIPHRALAHARTRPSHPAYYERTAGAWKATTWRDYADLVRRAGRALVSLGVERGHAVGILGFNKPEWVITDLAAMAIGAVPAGIYTTSSPDEVHYILEHAEVGVVVVENEAQWRKVEQVRKRLPALRHIVTMRGCPVIDDPTVLTWDAFLAKADATSDATFDSRLDALAPDDLATLIYTSGTTGPPKGVMLSHENLAWTARLACELGRVSADDSSVSYLPLCHIAEQIFSIHVPATGGSQLYYAQSIEKLADDLKDVQPTVFLGVPRIWEKLHAGVTAKLADAPAIRQRLASWAMSVGRRAVDHANRGEPMPLLLRPQHAIASKLVHARVRPLLGLGRARFCVTGAAPISPEVIELFAGLGITVLEVYGQSEGSGPTSFNLPGRTKFGSVGPPLPGVEVRIAGDGEILVRGPNVFLGYYKDRVATDETLVDGWLHSGDLGEIDRDGFLHITGRKKEILITAGGKNIAPKNIEAALKNHPLVGEAVVIGDRRKYLTALITLDPEASQRHLAAKGKETSAPHESPEIRSALQTAVDRVNTTLAQVETIKRFTILPRAFAIDTGELTPTLKIRRKVVAERWADEIESMYR